MRARFKGDPERNGSGPEVITAFGLTFMKGAWVGIDSLDPVSLRKIKGNSHFEVDAGKAASGQPTAAKAADAPEPEQIPENWREAHHSTRLKWARALGGTPANHEEANAIIERHLEGQKAPVEQSKPSIVDPPSKDDDWGDLDPE